MTHICLKGCCLKLMVFFKKRSTEILHSTNKQIMQKFETPKFIWIRALCDVLLLPQKKQYYTLIRHLLLKQRNERFPVQYHRALLESIIACINHFFKKPFYQNLLTHFDSFLFEAPFSSVIHSMLNRKTDNALLYLHLFPTFF